MKRTQERGVAAVEFALLLPVLALSNFGFKGPLLAANTTMRCE